MEDDFIKAGGEWREWRIGDLFNLVSLKKLNHLDTREFRTTVKTERNKISAVVAKVGNNGIMYYVGVDDFETAENMLVVIGDGAVAAGIVYYQSQKFTILHNAYAIELCNKLHRNRFTYLFVKSALQKSIFSFYGYENKPTWNKVKENYIKLPTKNGEIAFQYMESYIKTLEAERIETLEAYLTVTKLKDYHLTQKEKQAIEDISSLTWKSFKMGDLFDRLKTKKLAYKAKELPKEMTEMFDLPALTSSFLNQGLNYYVPRDEATILKNVISLPSNSDVYRAYYQSRDFTVLSDSYAISWKSKEEQRLADDYLFMVSSINKVTDLPIYSYKNKLGGWNVVQEKFVHLPVAPDGDIDFAYMRTLMSALKKRTIKNVVLYAQEQIEATREVVEQASVSEQD